MFQDFQKNWKEAWVFNIQSWRLIRGKVNFRYWLLWLINVNVGIQLMLRLQRGFELQFALVLVAVILYYALSPLTLLLWVPQHVKQKKPHYYRGILRSIGERIGGPYYYDGGTNSK